MATCGLIPAMAWVVANEFRKLCNPWARPATSSNGFGFHPQEWIGGNPPVIGQPRGLAAGFITDSPEADYLLSHLLRGVLTQRLLPVIQVLGQRALTVLGVFVASAWLVL